MSGSLDLGLTRREAGGDSLGLMRLSLALEKSLGRKLTFDQLDSDMTAPPGSPSAGILPAGFTRR